MNWIDAHCHLADPRYDGKLDDVIRRSKEANVYQWLQGGTCPEDWARQKQLRKTYGDGVLLSFGLHPWWVARTCEKGAGSMLDTLANEASGAMAIGEVGLDGSSRFHGTEGLQREVFKAQLQLAKQCDKPVILHVVKAHEAALAALESVGPFPRGGMVHAFSESIVLAQKYWSLGFLISVGAAALRKDTAREMVAHLPAEVLAIETDSPDQLPTFLSLPAASLNEPCYLVRIAEKVGELRSEPVEKVLATSSRNVRAMLGTLALLQEKHKE